MVTAGYLEKDVKVGDLKLHYQEWGSEGAPVILALHGFGLSGHMFDEFAERVQDRYRIIALDQRGHGDSDWAPDGDYTREAFVRDLEGLCEALGLERFVLMGHSMGGLNAVAFTVKHPERVRALVLIDVGPEAAKEGVDNIRRFVQGPDELEFEEFVQLAHRFNPRRSIENIRERMRHRLRQTESGKWTWKFDKRFRQPDGQLRIGSDLSNDEMWALFRSVQVPTLLVRGAESDVLTQEVAERTVREMPRARLVVVPNAGHSVPGDNPDAFTTAVLEFLDDVEAGRFRGVAEQAGRGTPNGAEVMRRRPGTAVIVGAAAGVVVAVGAALLAARLYSERRRKRSRRRAVERVVRPLREVRMPEREQVQERVEQLFEELAAAGRRFASEARQRARTVDLERAREAALELAHLLEEQRQSAPARVREVRTKLREARPPTAARRALEAGRSLAAGLLERAPRRRRRRRWELWRR